jgi:autotransporter adhesin
VNKDISVAYQGVAMGFALSAAPLNLQPGEMGVSGGVGSFEGKTALSFRFQAVSAGGNFTWGASVGKSNDSTGVGIGFGYKFPSGK